MDIPFLENMFSSLTKAGLLFFLFLYIVFAFLVLRQVNLMTKTLQVGLEAVIRSVAVLHFLISIVIFVYAFLML